MWRAFLDLVQIMRQIRALDRLRTSQGPRTAIASARKAGSGRRIRAEAERLRLRQFIAAIDRRLPGGPNCYRRALVEMALDGGAAAEVVQLGFRDVGGAGSGHAWLGGEIEQDDKGSPYDAIVSL